MMPHDKLEGLHRAVWKAEAGTAASIPAAEEADTGQMLHLREPEVPREVRGCGVVALRGVGAGGEG